MSPPVVYRDLEAWERIALFAVSCALLTGLVCGADLALDYLAPAAPDASQGPSYDPGDDTVPPADTANPSDPCDGVDPLLGGPC